MSEAKIKLVDVIIPDAAKVRRGTRFHMPCWQLRCWDESSSFLLALALDPHEVLVMLSACQRPCMHCEKQHSGGDLSRFCANVRSVRRA